MGWVPTPLLFFMTNELQKKVDRAIRLLRQIPTDKGPIEVSYSGGKDSDVILELARMAGIPFEAIYKNTTIDPPGTIAHCKENGVTIINPRITFLKLIENNGYPSRFRRFCCSKLKEYKVYNNAVQGVRRCESKARADRYKEPQVCRFYGSKKNHVSVWLPILEWTDNDVKEFVSERGIKCHPLYYREGNFDVSQRLGCMGCPLQSRKKRLEFFANNPKWLKAWINAGNKYYCEKGKKTRSGYEAMAADILFETYSEYEESISGPLLFETERKTGKQMLEEYFKIEL